MGPHAENFDGSLRFEDLINQAVLDIDATGDGSGEIADQFFVWRRIAERIFGEDGEEFLDFGPQTRGGSFFGVLLGLTRVDDLPV